MGPSGARADRGGSGSGFLIERATKTALQLPLSQILNRHSPLATRPSLFNGTRKGTINGRSLPTPHSPLPTRRSPLPTPHSPLPTRPEQHRGSYRLPCIARTVSPKRAHRARPARGQGRVL